MKVVDGSPPDRYLSCNDLFVWFYDSLISYTVKIPGKINSEKLDAYEL
jgi:hypothetical protein